VNDREVRVLAEAVAQSSNIIRLDLRGNSITNEGFIELVYGALDSPRLKTVNLRGNRIDQKGLVQAYRICTPRCEAGSAIEFSSEDGILVAIMTVPLSNKNLRFDLRANLVTKKHLENMDTLLRDGDIRNKTKNSKLTIGHKLKFWLRDEKLETLRANRERLDHLRAKPESGSVVKAASNTEEILKMARSVLEDAKVAAGYIDFI